MSAKGLMLVALVASVGFVVPSMAPVADAGHFTRFVWPYGLEERWVPVIAGYEIVPPPLQCDVGTGAGTSILSASFEGTIAPFSFENANVGAVRHSSNNQWHLTSFAGKGTDDGHTGPGRLYFGNDATGVYRSAFSVTQGSAVVTVPVPAGPAPWFVSFHTKWETEWLEGYDHMWVEAIPADGRMYILCTLNPEGRGDPSSSDSQSLGSCSPYSVAVVVCPTSARRINNLLRPAVPQGIGIVDPGAPHWESRGVMIPPIWNGQNVKLRFTFDSADPVANAYMGWMLDDVRVTDLFVPGPSALPVVGNLS